MSKTDNVYRCTLTQDEAAGRIDEDRALANRVVDTERLEHGIRVTFTGADDSRQLVDTFVANESRCCGFFDFTVTESDDAVALEITAPATGSAQRLVEAAKQTFELGPDAMLPLSSWEVDRG